MDKVMALRGEKTGQKCNSWAGQTQSSVRASRKTRKRRFVWKNPKLCAGYFESWKVVSDLGPNMGGGLADLFFVLYSYIAALCDCSNVS